MKRYEKTIINSIYAGCMLLGAAFGMIVHHESTGMMIGLCIGFAVNRFVSKRTTVYKG